MDIHNKLTEIGLSPSNSIVIGSGILNALKLRKSNDIDVVVTPEMYRTLLERHTFTVEENHGKEILYYDPFEIGASWTVVGKTWTYQDLLNHTIIIDGVRYITVPFLLEAKKSWVAQGEGRQKDLDDISLMEDYLSPPPTS